MMQSSARGRFAAITALVASFIIVFPASAGAAVSPPAQVTSVRTIGQDWPTKRVHLGWATQSGVSYVLKWSTSPSFSTKTYLDVTSASAWLTGIEPGTDYYVVVAAKKNGVSGKWSSTFRTRLAASSVSLPTSVQARGAVGGINLTWNGNNASEYEIRMSAGPNPNRVPDRWSSRWVPWFDAFGSSSRSRFVPSAARDLTDVAFGNPIYAQVYARNTFYDPSAYRKSAQVVAWPKPVAPASVGLTVNFGSYNVMCSTCEGASGRPWSERRAGVAKNIVDAELDIVTLQEASGPAVVSNAQVYSDIATLLPDMRLVDAAPYSRGKGDQGARILYDPKKFEVVSKGLLTGVKDYRSNPALADLNLPWARLRALDGSGVEVVVVSGHFALPAATDADVRKSALGQDSRQLIDAVRAINPPSTAGVSLPVILGADLNDSRFPENRADGAQPTLVREGGFYDASASLKRVGTERSTYNYLVPPNEQSSNARIVDPNGDGQRIDYILTQGFQGSAQFTNHFNGGSSPVPSDHNLISSSLVIPHGAS
jgi:endonuclease/exonuclease/phosphatase family metal-dependent hydrolase